MNKDHFFFLSTPHSEGKSFWRDVFENGYEYKPELIGIDWAKNSGMNRGDIINKVGNVIEVRFKTVGA